MADEQHDGTTENHDAELSELYQEAERDFPKLKTVIRIDDITILVRDVEYIFTLRQLLTPQQRAEVNAFWASQPREVSEAAGAAVERMYHEVLGYPRPTFDPRTATVAVYRKRR